MTDDERKEAERLAERLVPRNEDAIDSKYLHHCIVLAYAAACEAKRAEVDHWSQKYGHYVDKWNDSDRLRNQRDLELKAERARSAKLIQTLRSIEAMETNADFMMESVAREAIKEYEAGI